ncbi:MAG: hypothetical protein MJE77_12310 [Proteobacteria bacterium]|nr:hypothetical protein [Pseudomonadota bacterium]
MLEQGCTCDVRSVDANRTRDLGGAINTDAFGQLVAAALSGGDQHAAAG